MYFKIANNAQLVPSNDIDVPKFNRFKRLYTLPKSRVTNKDKANINKSNIKSQCCNEILKKVNAKQTFVDSFPYPASLNSSLLINEKCPINNLPTVVRFLLLLLHHCTFHK